MKEAGGEISNILGNRWTRGERERERDWDAAERETRLNIVNK